MPYLYLFRFLTNIYLNHPKIKYFPYIKKKIKLNIHNEKNLEFLQKFLFFF
jgi:hypothetical protein